MLQIEKAPGIGFCFGVRRAIRLLEEQASKYERIETLGGVVHNQQVQDKLAKMNIIAINNISKITASAVAISSHGVSPEVVAQIREKGAHIIDTTCPFVRRAQVTARKLADSNFFVIIYGDAGHSEVKGILGWAGGKGIATLDSDFLEENKELPGRIGILSQTTQIPEQFSEFAKKVIDKTLKTDSEIRIIDTICHDVRKRQEAAFQLAGKVELMLVVGGRNSANTRRLAELCAAITRVHQIETAREIEPSWLEGISRTGVTSGTSTSDESIDEVVARLEQYKNS